jgi:signal peptidase
MPKKNNKRMNAWRIISNIIFVLVIVLALVVIISKFSIGGLKIYVVNSGSMAPKIKTGSLIFSIKRSNYQVGQIITYQPREIINGVESITHRVVEVKNNYGIIGYITKGDVNDSNDAELVLQDKVLGEYVFGIPYIGYLVHFVKTVPGLILLIVIPATIIIYEEGGNVIKEIKKNRRKKMKEKLQAEEQNIE